jgi:prophage regulatory protein
MNAIPAGSILRLPQVRAITGLSKSSLYAMIASGDFPSQVRLGARAVGWISDQVFAWVAARPQA